MKIRHLGPTLLVLAMVLLVMVLGPHLMQTLSHRITAGQLEATRTALKQDPFLAQLNTTFPAVADAVRPSLVHISTQSQVVDDDQDPASRRIGRSQGTGSGWVFDDLGHIITNEHVIEDADFVQVRFADGSTYPAEVIGMHAATDVAVIRVDGVPTHPAIRATEPVRQGEVVFAFGSPFAEFDFSMSQGVVSATARSIAVSKLQGRLQNFIQTDAAINPGNSGGPLTDVYGQVVGMNTAILAGGQGFGGQEGQAGTFLGLGFAVPVDMVTAVAEQLIEAGHVERGILGVRFEDAPITQGVADMLHYEGMGGVLVLSTETGSQMPSPAAEAGIQKGDLITAIDGRSIASGYELQALVATQKPGTVLQVDLWRAEGESGERLQVPVTLAAWPEQRRR